MAQFRLLGIIFAIIATEGVIGIPARFEVDHLSFAHKLGHESASAVEHLFQTLNPSIPNVLPEYYLRTPVYRLVVSPEECEKIVDAAETHALLKGGWDTKRHRNYPTVDLDTKEISSIRGIVWEITTERVFPHMAKEFNLTPEHLILNEAFVVKYTTTGQRMLDAHRDNSEFSFVVALNDGYDGGGTLFVHKNETIKPSKGSVVLFGGKNLHQGLEVLGGARYILAGFVFLANHDRKVASIFDASTEGDMHKVKWLVNRVDPGLVHAQRDGSLETPLIETAYHGHFQIAEYLLQHGALVNQQYTDGFTALYLASQEGRLELVDLLLRHGANHWLGLHKASGKTTPLQIASKKGHMMVVNRLLQHDSTLLHINKPTSNHHVALWFACSQGCMDVAELLIGHGANFSTDTYNTALIESRHPVGEYSTTQEDARIVLCKAMGDK